MVNLFKIFESDFTSYTKCKFDALSIAGIGKEDNQMTDIVCFLLITDSNKTEEPFAVYTISEHSKASDILPVIIS